MELPASIIRVLAPSEEMFAQTGLYICPTQRITGGIDVSTFQAAFEMLLYAHPVLSCHLELGPDGRHQIVADDLMHLGIWVVDVSATSSTDDTGGFAPDQAVALANLQIALDIDQADVTLLVHHCVADGHHTAALMYELWTYYTDLVSGKDVGPVIQPAPDSLEVLLNDRCIQKCSRSGLERFIPAMTKAPQTSTAIEYIEPGVIPNSRVVLNCQDTENLLELSREAQITINAVVSAAILLAEWQLRGTPDIPIPYIYPVDLRHHLTPPVEPTAGTSILGVSTYLAEIEAGTQLLDLARDISATLNADLADGTVQQSLLHFNIQYEGTWPGLPEIVIATNVGRIPAMPTPESIRTDSLEIRIYATSAARIAFFLIITFGGQLTIERHAHYSSSEATLEMVHSTLSAIASEH